MQSIYLEIYQQADRPQRQLHLRPRVRPRPCLPARQRGARRDRGCGCRALLPARRLAGRRRTHTGKLRRRGQPLRARGGLRTSGRPDGNVRGGIAAGRGAAGARRQGSRRAGEDGPEGGGEVEECRQRNKKSKTHRGNAGISVHAKDVPY